MYGRGKPCETDLYSIRVRYHRTIIGGSLEKTRASLLNSANGGAALTLVCCEGLLGEPKSFSHGQYPEPTYGGSRSRSAANGLALLNSLFRKGDYPRPSSLDREPLPAASASRIGQSGTLLPWH